MYFFKFEGLKSGTGKSVLVKELVEIANLYQF